MSTHNDGGPAFPVSQNKTDPEWAAARDGGMTLRDYFAAKAMQGALAEALRWGPAEFDKDIDVGALAKFAFKSADAMLAARGAA